MDQVFTRYFRSSHQFSVKVVLKNLANFIVKTLCRSLFLINLQAWRHATLSKRDPNTGSMKFPKFSEHLFWRTFANNCSRCFKRSHWTLHWGFCILMNVYEFFKFSTLASICQYGNTLWAMHLHYIMTQLSEKETISYSYKINWTKIYFYYLTSLS